MINIDKISSSEPYSIFKNLYQKALTSDQKVIEAISISSYDKKLDEVESRHVNLKYIIDEEWIFFSNYNSPKAKQFLIRDQITALIFWNSINVQIRIKAKIRKTDKNFSDIHYEGRTKEKNALAHSSNQSQVIKSYNEVIKNYEETLANKCILKLRPSFWGGFSFEPYYFEFWEGNQFRLNKREVFEKFSNNWKKSFLQP